MICGIFGGNDYKAVSLLIRSFSSLFQFTHWAFAMCPSISKRLHANGPVLSERLVMLFASLLVASFLLLNTIGAQAMASGLKDDEIIVFFNSSAYLDKA